MDDIKVTLLDPDEPLPKDAVVLPDIADIPVEQAVSMLMDQGLDEADARFFVDIARGEIDGDTIAVKTANDVDLTPPRRSDSELLVSVLTSSVRLCCSVRLSLT